MREAAERRRAAWDALNTRPNDVEEGPVLAKFEAANEAMRDIPIKSDRDAVAALSVALEEIRTFGSGPAAEDVEETLIKNAIAFLGGSAAHG